MPASRRFTAIIIINFAVALLASSAIAWGAASGNLNPAKLKPGQTIEVKHAGEWVVGKVDRVLNEQMVRVKVPSVSFAIPVLMSNARLPSKAASSPATENPFATEEERVAARKPRTWKAAVGKFSVEATLLRIDEGKAVLKRDDDKEISVAVESLSEKDQEYIESIFPSESTTSPRKRRDQDKPSDPDLPIVETNLGAAAPLQLSAKPTGDYVPDCPEVIRLKNVRIPVEKEFFDRPEHIFLVPQEKRAFLIMKDNHPADHKVKVQSIDLQRGKVDSTGVFGIRVMPIDISPNGKWILAQLDSGNGWCSGQLRLYKRDGTKVTPVKAWVPYSHHGPGVLSSHTNTLEYPGNAHVKSASFLDDDHIMCVSANQEFSIWTVDDLKPVFQAEVAHGTIPAITPSGKYIALLVKDGIAIVRSSDGKLVKKYPTEFLFGFAEVAFSPDGKRLALLSAHHRLRLWNLEDDKLLQDIPLPKMAGPMARGTSLAWASDDYLLLSGSLLVNVNNLAFAYDANRQGTWKNYFGQFWQYQTAMKSAALISEPAVPESVEPEMAQKTLEENLVVAPGMEVMVDLQTTDPNSADAREQIIQSLTQRGIKVVPQSDIKLVGKITPGETKNIQYKGFGIRGAVSSVSVQEKILTLSYTVDNEVVWEHKGVFGAPHMLHMKHGQTPEDVVREATAINSKAFENIWLPVTIPRPIPRAPLNKQVSLPTSAGS